MYNPLNVIIADDPTMIILKNFFIHSSIIIIFPPLDSLILRSSLSILGSCSPDSLFFTTIPSYWSILVCRIYLSK